MPSCGLGNVLNNFFHQIFIAERNCINRLTADENNRWLRLLTSSDYGFDAVSQLFAAIHFMINPSAADVYWLLVAAAVWCQLVFPLAAG